MVARVSAGARYPRGFTLVELLVALFITAILFAMGYGALTQALNNRKQVEEQAKRLSDLQQTFRVMEQDIELLQPRPVRDVLGNGYQYPFELHQNALNSVGSADSAAAANGAAQLSQALINFTRGGWANPAGLPRSELQRVGYLIRDGKLIRQHLPVLDTTAATPVVERELIDQVEAIKFRFMDDTLSWSEIWPTPLIGAGGQQAQLRARPVAVEIMLKLKDFGELVRVVEVAG